MSGICLESLWEYKMRRLLTIIIVLNPGEIRDTLQLTLHFPSRVKVTVNDLIKARRMMGEGQRHIQEKILVQI